MKKNQITSNRFQFCGGFLVTVVSLMGMLFLSIKVLAQDAPPKESNETLLNQYVKSKGNEIIIFSASNIKQFWIDNSVVSRNNSVDILLKSQKSVAFPIQLSNVKESQDCRIDVITEVSDLEFSILDDRSKEIVSSQKEEDFLNYSVHSCCFHLEDIYKFLFKIVFYSDNTIVSIKKIILSFSDNKDSNFLSSPGAITFTSSDIIPSASLQTEEVSKQSFKATGKRTNIIPSKKIYTTNNTLSASVKIKNIGEVPTTLYIGYELYNKDCNRLDVRNYLHQKTNKILNVISSSAGSNRIIVDSCTDWIKNGVIALNAKEDMSDIPNCSIVDGKIVEVRQLENGQAEIELDKPLKTAIERGTNVRIHRTGGGYIYTNTKVLAPGEEEEFKSTIKKDESSLEYSQKVISKGTYYVIPVILSHSTDPDKENTILIEDYTVSY